MKRREQRCGAKRSMGFTRYTVLHSVELQQESSTSGKASNAIKLDFKITILTRKNMNIWLYIRNTLIIIIILYRHSLCILYRLSGGIRGTVLELWTAGQQVEGPILRQRHFITKFISFAQVVSSPV